MISCGLQCLSCDYPVHMDTYAGCSHACRYCFANERKSISNIEPLNSTKGLKQFIAGKRNKQTVCFDWDIPLHWGANADPFQPCEKEYRCSLDCLKVFAETKYPFIVSTKNPVMLTEEPYFSLIKECNCVLQISMACSRYDKLETGAPSYRERLKAAGKLSKHVPRIIARVQPYFIDCLDDVLAELPNMADAGIYGIIISGYTTRKKQKGMTREGRKYKFTVDELFPAYKTIKEACHNVGLRFFCSEYGLDWMGDDLTCCGTEGLDGFKPNRFTLTYLTYAPELAMPTDTMMQAGTTYPFKCIRQTQAFALQIKDKSYYDMIMEYAPGYIDRVQGEREKYSEKEV